MLSNITRRIRRSLPRLRKTTRRNNIPSILPITTINRTILFCLYLRRQQSTIRRRLSIGKLLLRRRLPNLRFTRIRRIISRYRGVINKRICFVGTTIRLPNVIPIKTRSIRRARGTISKNTSIITRPIRRNNLNPTNQINFFGDFLRTLVLNLLLYVRSKNVPRRSSAISSQRLPPKNHVGSNVLHRRSNLLRPSQLTTKNLLPMLRHRMLRTQIRTLRRF